VSVARIRAMGERYGDRFLQRVYAPSELATCSRADRWQCLAGRWAAKEAVIKLLPAREASVAARDRDCTRPGGGSLSRHPGHALGRLLPEHQP